MFSSWNFIQNYGKISAKICAKLSIDKKCGKWYNSEFGARQPHAHRPKTTFIVVLKRKRGENTRSPQRYRRVSNYICR